MYKIKTLNKISKVGLANLDLTKYTCGDNEEGADGILVRSAAMHDYEFNPELKGIARAGAGVNNIPLDRCTEAGIAVFNTPGANANGVKELAVCGMLLACRDVIGGANWVKANKDEEGIAKLVEKEKSKFAGIEIAGKTLGIIGLGAIGGPLANAAVALGMKVIGCDPYMSVDAALKINSAVTKVDTREEIFAKSDFISIHTPLIDNADPKIRTKHMINKDTIALMKDGVIILNFARDALVNDDDMEEALKAGKVRRYVTDFPNARTAGMEGVIAIPHLGASTEESEDNCAVMAVKELTDFIENGNTVNSVNFPNVYCERSSGTRLCVLHKNIPNMISVMASACGELGLNIEHMQSKSKGDISYAIIDLTDIIDATAIVEKLGAVEGIMNVSIR